jgi:Tol biopolymer transport system component
MSDYRSLLERDLRLAGPADFSFQDLTRRRDRKRRNQRLAAGVVAIFVVAAGIGVAIGMVNLVGTPRPANPSPTPESPKPIPESADPFAQVHGWITYRDGSHIMAVDPAHPTNRISLGPSRGLDPIEWSRDGSRLLLRYSHKTEDLYALNADGSRVRLTKGGTSYSGSFSPDGKKVVYEEVISSEGGFSSETGLYVIDSAGGTQDLLVAAGGRTALSDPAWSPDGSRIAFIEHTIVGETEWGEPIYRLTLSVINADGTERRVLRELGREDRSPTGWARGLVWSPDGSRLAFSSARYAYSGRRVVHRWPSQIYVVNADGSELRRLTDDDSPTSDSTGKRDNDTPAWSPDGSQIAFQCRNHLCAMAVDGSDLRTVIAAFPSGAMTWNPAERVEPGASQRDEP